MNPHLPRWRLAVLKRARVLAMLCLVGLSAPLLSRGWANEASSFAWLVDLACHWQWLYVAGLCVFGSLAAWIDRRWLVLALALPLPWLLASPAAPRFEGAVPTLTLVSANVHFDNLSAQPLVRWLEQAQPDVVMLQEVTSAYADGLKGLAAYPYRKLAAQDSPFGIALFSRYPLSDVVVQQDDEGVQTLTARMALNGRMVSLVAMHPMPPISAGFRRARDLKLAAQARAARESGLATIVAGDLNASPWAAGLRFGLAPTLKRAMSLAPTWPSLGAGVMGIPIDQILVSRHWGVVSSSRGPDLGSDHLPVLAKLALLPAPQK